MNDWFSLLQNFALLFAESAPWLLLGLLIAGIMHELIPMNLLEKHMGKSSLSAISKAAVIGAPLPLCSCGVIPAAIGLRRSGASKPATTSFLVATPETGVDSISVSYALLGPLFAIVRPLAAIISAIYSGLMVKWFSGDEDVRSDLPSEASRAVSSCCSETTSSCCDQPEKKEDTDPATGMLDHSSRILSYASGQLLEDITLWLLIGLALAAAIQTWVPTEFLTRWGDGLLAMLVMALIGIPMYICATASTPIALGLLGAGLSPGAILVFMLAGPATNIATMGMIAREMGKRTLSLYLFSVISASLALGFGLNLLVQSMDWEYLINSGNALEHQGDEQLVYVLSAVVLAALMVRNFRRKWRQRKGKDSEHCCQ